MSNLDKAALIIAKTDLIPTNTIGEALAEIGRSIYEPFKQLVEALAKQFQDMMDKINEKFAELFKSIKFITTLQPIYTARPVQQPPPTPEQSKRYVDVTIDPLGFFIMDGQRLTILNPGSSKCGKILRTLLTRKAELVHYEVLKEEMGSGDFKEMLKDLKKQLRKKGFELETDTVQKVGIAFKGVTISP